MPSSTDDVDNFNSPTPRFISAPSAPSSPSSTRLSHFISHQRLLSHITMQLPTRKPTLHHVTMHHSNIYRSKRSSAPSHLFQKRDQQRTPASSHDEPQYFFDQLSKCLFNSSRSTQQAQSSTCPFGSESSESSTTESSSAATSFHRRTPQRHPSPSSPSAQHRSTCSSTRSPQK